MNARARVQAVPVLLAASLGLTPIGKLLAHDGPHTAASLQPTGFEEIALEITEEGVTGMPESIAAGRYLVKVSGPPPGEMGPSGAIFLQFPEGVTAESAYEGIMASGGEMPEWFLQAHWGGGVTLATGPESWGIVDFTPGSWATSTLFGTTLGVPFEVTGEVPADLQEPEANVTIELIEMQIVIADGALVAGENVVTVKNLGAQIHFVDVGLVPDGTTEEQVDALFESMMTGTPVAGDDALKEDDLTPVAYLNDISGGVQTTLPLALEAGTYFLSCWIPDPETMMPHAMMGMWTLVTVE